MEVAQRRSRARLSPVLRQQRFEFRAPCGIRNNVTWSKGDPGDGRFRLRRREARLVREELNRLIDAPSAAGQLRIDDGPGAAHAFPLRSVVARIEIVAVETELHEEFFAVERPAFTKFTTALDFADEVRVAAGDRQLQKVARQGFVRGRRKDAIAVE